MIINIERPKSGWELIEDKLRENESLVEKYNKPGIYCIKVRGQIIYIGKSMNMLTRVAQHMFEIDKTYQKSHKYKVLKEIRNMGEDIQFDVMERCYRNESR